MNEDGPDWKMEKRFTWGNLLTIVTVTVGILIWFVRVEGSVSLNAAAIEANSEAIQSLKLDVNEQYSEIIRRLERLDSNQRDHLNQHD